MNTIKKLLLDCLGMVPDAVLPVKVSKPHNTEDGLCYGLLERNPLDGGLALYDIYNGPKINPTLMPLGQFGPVRLVGFLVDAMKAVKAFHRWDFVQDEERYLPNGQFFWTGVLTDGIRFLYWKTDPMDRSFERTFCHIYNSILMTEDQEEIYFPWTSENSNIVTDCLNSLENPDDFCGDGGALEQLEFLPWEKCEIWDSIRSEDIRHKVSPLLNGTDEDNQLECNIPVCGGKAVIDRCYQIPGDGTMWFHVVGEGVDVDEEGYANFDAFGLEDLEVILKALS